MIALIDGDVIRYRVGFAAQKTWHYVWRKGDEESFGFIARYGKKKEAEEYIKGDDELYITPMVEAEPLPFCLHSVKQLLKSILDDTGADSYIVYLTGDRELQLRNALAKTKPYKGNRDPLHKPVHYHAITEYLKEVWHARTIDILEADDAMAREQFVSLQTGVDSIICTIDKDLNQIPGWHYNFVTKTKYWVTAEEGMRFFYEQLLQGDTTDNIQGVPKVGPKTAKKLLEPCKTEQEHYDVCIKTYEKAYGQKAKEVLVEMANLLYMRPDEKFLWIPPHERKAKADLH